MVTNLRLGASWYYRLLAKVDDTLAYLFQEDAVVGIHDEISCFLRLPCVYLVSASEGNVIETLVHEEVHHVIRKLIGSKQSRQMDALLGTIGTLDLDKEPKVDSLDCLVVNY